MKSISVRILFLTLFTMLSIIISFSYVSYRFANDNLNESYDQIISKGTELWSTRFDGYLKQKEVAIDTVKHLIEKRITLEDLTDAELLSPQLEYMAEIMSSMVQSMNYLNLYAWFHPDYVSPELMMLSVRNYDLDGTIKIVTGNTYTTEDMTAENWDWFNNAIKNDVELSDPFYWEDYDVQLNSFTKSLIIEGEKAGVVGSDYYIHELEQMMLEKPFMKNGHYALLNKDLMFLIHPHHSFKHWNEVYPADYEKAVTLLADESIESGVFMSGSQKIGFNRMNSG